VYVCDCICVKIYFITITNVLQLLYSTSMLKAGGFSTEKVHKAVNKNGNISKKKEVIRKLRKQANNLYSAEFNKGI